eukprot:CAMPEP_0206206364 /NCGR_PEP_ID=MMETSP0166-20121206/14874_1 /ASSEMBLY_ACC=CAM_ASM_000260 /TAXON_ID=95228 /ORGANISM="Vannella robusta, Strain DIVA3 518/3/11/1/6" /LENGTH=95 /DNA_ID=CAMNT_0053626765 /DNA_START=246 /DNA_END=530 /DNA_ORIENTATION=+
MIAMYTFGSYVFHFIGLGGFTLLYTGAALASSAAFAYSTPFDAGQGASGVITGMAATASIITPLEEVLIMGIPVPLKRAVIGLFMFDLAGYTFGS